MRYFSEREEGESPREREEIGAGPWGGILALIRARIENGSFGASHPVACEDGRGSTRCDERAFWRALCADVPTIQEDRRFEFDKPPRTLDILDTIEFCWRCLGHPVRGKYHEAFDHEGGRGEFRKSVNRIFRCNGLAYELTEQGQVERLAPPVLREALASAQLRTGEPELDRMLETARRKFLDPDEAIRREALEVLWDAWERLKTLGRGRDKKAQVESILNHVAGASSPRLREALEREANELNRIGNHFQIRHAETTQERLVQGEQADYLFHRLFSLIQLILRTKEWARARVPVPSVLGRETHSATGER